MLYLGPYTNYTTYFYILIIRLFKILALIIIEVNNNKTVGGDNDLKSKLFKSN